MGMGRYNVETAQARSINADTAMQWNQYIYDSQMRPRDLGREGDQREDKRKHNYKAIQARVRN